LRAAKLPIIWMYIKRLQKAPDNAGFARSHNKQYWWVSKKTVLNLINVNELETSG